MLPCRKRAFTAKTCFRGKTCFVAKTYVSAMNILICQCF